MRTKCHCESGPVTIQSRSSRTAVIEALRSELRVYRDEQTTPKHPLGHLDVRSGSALSLSAGTHEWFGAEDVDGIAAPPLALLADLARRKIREPASGGYVVWIGRACWPYPHALCSRVPDLDTDTSLLARSLFVDPPDHATRVWAIDLALRSVGAMLVIADGSGLSMAESRRLQLAASSSGTAGVLVRPERDQAEISAARTRWLVEPACETGILDQAWTVHLLRCKGLQPASWSARKWVVRRDHATGTCDPWTPHHGGVVDAVDDRSAAPATAPSTHIQHRRLA